MANAIAWHKLLIGKPITLLHYTWLSISYEHFSSKWEWLLDSSNLAELKTIDVARCQRYKVGGLLSLIGSQNVAGPFVLLFIVITNVALSWEHEQIWLHVNIILLFHGYLITQLYIPRVWSALVNKMIPTIDGWCSTRFCLRHVDGALSCRSAFLHFLEFLWYKQALFIFLFSL